MSKLTKVLLGSFLAVLLATSTTGAATYTWTRSLSKGSTGADVKSLQQFLNMCSDSQVSMSGAGSPGNETSTFGAATKAAVIKWQTARGVSPASGMFGPLSRAKAAALQASTNVCGSGVVVTPPSGGPQTGPVTATLAQDNPAAGTIVAGQATADLMHVTFTGSGTVNSVTLTRGGISDQNTLTNVYLYDGVQRLTDGYSFNTNGIITMNNLNLAVNGSRTISVKADVYSTTSSYDIYVTLSSFSAGTAVNTVSIKGNDMFIAGNGALATASVSGANTVSAASVNAGTSSYTVWRAPIQVNTRALKLKAANFRITGSAPSDALQNVGLYVDGVKAGNNAALTMTNGSNYLSFDLTAAPLNLTTGSHTVEVRGDVVKGSSYNLTVSLQQASDLMVMDPQVGVNVALSGTIPNAAGQISIGTGSFTAVVDPTFSSMTNVTASATNVAIARFKLHGYGEDIKVTSLPITTVLTSPSPSAAGLQNVTLYFNGAQIGSQQSLAIGLNTFSLGSQMIIPAGADSILEVRADLRTTGGANYTAGQISANLGAATAEGWNSHASITGPTATGNILSMQTGTLGLSKNSGYANQNANPNTSGVKIGSFVMQNQSTSESIRVTSLLVNLAYGAGTSSSNLSGLRTSETSGNAGTPQQPATAAASSNANNTFSTDFTLAPGAVKTIDIFADSGSDANVGGTSTVISTVTVTSLGMISNVSATSAATSGQTITFRTGTLGTPTVNTASSTVAQLVAAANGGSSDGSLAQYNFTSTNASATISELTFSVNGPSAATYVKVGSVSAPVVSGIAYLTGLNIAVPNGGSGTNVSVYVSYPEVGTSGLSSGTLSTLSLATVKSTSGNTTTTTNLSSAATTYTSGAVTAGSQTIVVGSTTGMLPGQVITIAGATTAVGTITSVTNGTTVVVNLTTGGVTPAGAVTFYGVPAPSMTLVGSKPTYTLAASTDPLVNGSVKVAEITVAADAKGDIKLAQLPITLTSTNGVTVAGSSNNILVQDTSGATIATTNASFALLSGGTTSGNICFDTAVSGCASGNSVANGYLIPAGTSKTFRIYFTVGGVSGAVNTVSLSAKLGAASSATYYDVAGGASSTQSATLLYGYPTNTSTIHN